MIGGQYSGIWAGWTDVPKEGIFVDMNDDNVTMQSVGVNLWRKSEPNGDLRENCVLLDGFEFTDLNCDKKYCGICDMAAAPVFKLRGKIFVAILCFLTRIFILHLTVIVKFVLAKKIFYNKSIINFHLLC